MQLEPPTEHLLERVRGDPGQFDDEVRRFLRTHPGACAQLPPPPTRRFHLVS